MSDNEIRTLEARPEDNARLPALPALRESFLPRNFEEAVKFSELVARTSFVPKEFAGKPGEILAAIMYGYEVGLSPMQALQSVAVINGKPVVYGDAPLALVYSSGKLEWIKESDNGDIATCEVKRRGEATPHISTFSMADAKEAGLLGRGGAWTSYKKRMRQMRARGFALRDTFPDVLKGLITEEEAGDYPVETTAKTIVVKPDESVKQRDPAQEAPKSASAGAISTEGSPAAAETNSPSGGAEDAGPLPRTAPAKPVLAPSGSRPQADVAQRKEQPVSTGKVAGSIPAVGTTPKRTPQLPLGTQRVVWIRMFRAGLVEGGPENMDVINAIIEAKADTKKSLVEAITALNADKGIDFLMAQGRPAPLVAETKTSAGALARMIRDLPSPVNGIIQKLDTLKQEGE